MNKIIKRGFLGICAVVGSSMLVVCIVGVHAKRTAEKNRPNRPSVAQPRLTSNPRQVLTTPETTITFASGEAPPATFSCNIQETGLIASDMDPYKGPLDCTGQSPQTITESTFNNFTYSGGRVSWWGNWQYGTILNGAFPPGTCESPPLVVQSAIPLAYINLSVHCSTINSTVTFTPNDGNVVQASCNPAGQATRADIFGINITQVTITSSPNNGLYIWGVLSPFASEIAFRQSQPCNNCPTIPVIP